MGDLSFRFFGDFDDGEYHGGYEEENGAIEDILEQFWGMCVLLDGCLGVGCLGGVGGGEMGERVGGVSVMVDDAINIVGLGGDIAGGVDVDDDGVSDED